MAFMHGKGRKPEKSVFTNMVMIEDKNGNVLVQRRIKGWNGLVFPGGHLNSKETFVESAIREIKEETGLVISDLKICGVKQWFSEEEGRNVCILFKTNKYEGDLKFSDEGNVFWMPLDELMSSSEVATGFDKMLTVFLREEINEMFYPDNGESNPILL